MQTCTCDRVLCQGPALLAADFHYQRQLRNTQQLGANKRQSQGEDGLVLHLLLRVTMKLEGDSPVPFNYADAAGKLDMDEDAVRAGIAWLVEHRYLVTDGTDANLAMLWVNPAVAFRAGKTDPRIAAARHRFPYIAIDEKGMDGERPIHVAEYDKDGWELVYRNNAEQFENPPRFPLGCPLHHDAVGVSRQTVKPPGAQQCARPTAGGPRSEHVDAGGTAQLRQGTR